MITSPLCARIVNYWNSLPSAVANAKTVTEFEKELERFRADQGLSRGLVTAGVINCDCALIHYQ